MALQVLWFPECFVLSPLVPLIASSQSSTEYAQLEGEVSARELQITERIKTGKDICIFRTHTRDGEMTHHVKMIVANTDCLSLSPRTSITEEQIDSHGLSFDLHMYVMTSFISPTPPQVLFQEEITVFTHSVPSTLETKILYKSSS